MKPKHEYPPGVMNVVDYELGPVLIKVRENLKTLGYTLSIHTVESGEFEITVYPIQQE